MVIISKLIITFATLKRKLRSQKHVANSGEALFTSEQNMFPDHLRMKIKNNKHTC